MARQLDINYAVVSAFERSKREERKVSSSHLFAIVLMAVFFIALMVSLGVGVSLYRSAADIHAETNALHLEAGLLANTVHMNDAVDAVGEGEGPEGRSLVLTQRLDSGTYEVRIYLYEGNIMQEYAVEGRPYNPKTAQAIVASSSFDFAFDGKLVTLITDTGSFDVAVRSAQGGGL